MHAMHDDSGMPPLELWAGMECTLNRVGNVQHDQLALAGHYGRPGDLALIASLGVRTMRYPILWERIDGSMPAGRPWEWTDGQMAELRRLSIDPIVGLMHHGSGPFDTDLLDSRFPERFAAFAREVAARYPWVTRYTPVNEPLTTARFSALYGIWHPHVRNDRHFLRALLNQVRATRLAMESIRTVTPGAELVQTEDLGYTHSTAASAEQATFENHRRWLTFDLLAARVDRMHPLWEYIRDCGIGEGEVADAVGDGCKPAVLGINHYVTSERWLDERLEHYPRHTHGGNHRLRYADVEAVRANPEALIGPATLLTQAWERYGLPLAITEAHLGCTREHQLRWFRESWDAAHQARESGAGVRAVTAWAALGTYDWSSLVTTLRGDYEPGLFDVRAARPRRTALGNMAHALATTGHHDHPALDSPGWWRVREASSNGEMKSAVSGRATAHPAASAVRSILVTGARGTLGEALVRSAADRGLACIALGRAELDICDADAVARALDQLRPWAVINAAGYVRVDEAEREPEACRRANVDGAVTLANRCATRGIAFATMSSDLVFDGAKGAPYLEGDRPAPLNVYGMSKAEAEAGVRMVHPRALVVRASWFFGPWDDWNFITTALRQVANGAEVTLPADLMISPTYLPHLADALLDLIIDGETGIWHLANDGRGSVVDIVRRVARVAELDDSLVLGCLSGALGLLARRPFAVPLASARGRVMPPLHRALDSYVESQAWLRSESAEQNAAASQFALTA